MQDRNRGFLDNVLNDVGYNQNQQFNGNPNQQFNGNPNQYPNQQHYNQSYNNYPNQFDYNQHHNNQQPYNQNCTGQNSFWFNRQRRQQHHQPHQPHMTQPRNEGGNGTAVLIIACTIILAIVYICTNS